MAPLTEGTCLAWPLEVVGFVFGLEAEVEDEEVEG